MKHFSKKLSWLLAFVLFFTNLAITDIPVSAAETDTITLDGTTDEVITSGTKVKTEDGNYYYYCIQYYESADSDTILYQTDSNSGTKTIGYNNIAVQPYAWHIKYLKREQDFSRTSTYVIYYKAYPATSLEGVPAGTTMTFSEGTSLTLPQDAIASATGSAISVSIYVGDTKLAEDSAASSKYTLPDEAQLRVLAGETFDSKINGKEFHLPNLTKLYYNVEIIDNTEGSYSLKLTLVETVEITLDPNSGTMGPSDITTWYATKYAPINGTILPSFTYKDKNFYGLKDYSNYVYLENVTADNARQLNLVSYDVTLKAMYQENKPTNFIIDSVNKKIKGLKAGREYGFRAATDHSPWYSPDYITADESGTISYNININSKVIQFCLKPIDSDDYYIVVNSEYVSLKHETPNVPVVVATATSARVTNAAEFTGCLFQLKQGSTIISDWGSSYEFSDLITKTNYTLYVKHPADEKGFESIANSVTFTLEAEKVKTPTISPNGETDTCSDTITITCETDGAVIYYTTDGTTPTVASIAYTGSFTLNNSATVKAIAIKSGIDDSDVASVDFVYSHIYDNDCDTTCNDCGAVRSITHDWLTAWSSNSTKHWHECSVCHEKSEEANHTPGAPATSTTPQTCTICGYILAPALGGGSSTPPPPYTAPTYTVMFNTDGGSTIDNKSIKEGTTIGEIPTPRKDGYVFGGWYMDKELTRAYDANTKITASTTLYAKWTKVEPTPAPADNSKNELVLTIGKKEANVFGSEKENVVAPMIKNGQPMLPVRFIAENLGAKVTWNGKKQLVTIKGKNEKGKNVTILITIGSKYAYVNGKKVKLDSPAYRKNGRVYTPMNFIPENLGASAKWNEAEQEVIITKKD